MGVIGMKGYVKKVGRTLLIGLIVALVALVVYAVYPKYQITTVYNGDRVVTTKLNKITGEVTTSSKSGIWTYLNKYNSGKKFSFD